MPITRTQSPATTVALHLVGAAVGDLELAERALLDLDGRFEVREHADGEALLEALAEPGCGPALLVFDIDRGQDELLSTLARLRWSEETAALPVVVVGSLRDPAEVSALYQAGVSAVVHKPRFVDLWLRTLRDLLRFWMGAALLPGPGPSAH